MSDHITSTECLFCGTVYAGNGPEHCPVCALRASRDKLAGLLREAINNIPAHEWINYTDGLSDRIDAALAEVEREGGEGADGRAERNP